MITYSMIINDQKYEVMQKVIIVFVGPVLVERSDYDVLEGLICRETLHMQYEVMRERGVFRRSSGTKCMKYEV